MSEIQPVRGFFHDYWKSFSLMILHSDRSTPGESLVRYIMSWNPNYQAEVLQRILITPNEKTLLMQLGPTSVKRTALSYFLPRGPGIFSILSHDGHSFIIYLQRTAKFYQEDQEAESLNVLNKYPFKDSCPRFIQHN